MNDIMKKQQEKNNAIVQKLKDTSTSVINQVMKYADEGKLEIPKNYSVGNSVNALRLMIMDDDKLRSCTLPSIANAMLNMCILGLNPSKKQCYPIAYGEKLGLMVSYFGNVAIAKRADTTIDDVVADVVKEGETFEFEHLPGNTYKVTKHTRTLESMDSDKILAAYATILYNDGKEPVTLIMTWKEILAAWKKSPAKPFDEDGNLKTSSTHAQYSDDMAKRTVINKITKMVRNTSDDSELFEDARKSVDYESSKNEAEMEVVENTCSEEEYTDVDYVEYDASENEVEEESGMSDSITVIKDTGEVVEG